MPRPRRVVRSRRAVILTLFFLAIVALLLPSSWTGRLISLLQVLVPFQHAASVTTDAVAGALTGDAPPVPAAVFEDLARRRAALENEVGSLQARVTELEEENAKLTRTRRFEVDGWRIGARGRLVPARVITQDILPWRSSRLINAGSLQGVRPGSPVTTRFFTVDQGTAVGLRSGMAVLRGEVLLGLVDDRVGTHVAQVKLLSDLSVEMRVRIGRLTDQGFVLTEPSFWLTGRGGTVMEIRGVDRRLVKDGSIQIGDTVLSDPATGRMPVALTIGHVTAIEPDHEKPLLSVLTVESAAAEARLERVWVYDPEIGAEGTEAAQD